MERQNISFTLGERLKKLREERDLSHDKLIKQLYEKYNISLSRDSVMAYEIADEFRAKASKLPNLGMRVETLYYLASFYGVSVDYLLGKTDEPVPNITIRTICEQTRLSPEAVEKLKVEGNCYDFVRMLVDALIREWHVYQPAARAAAEYWGHAEIADLIGSQKSEGRLFMEQILSMTTVRSSSQDGSKMLSYVSIPASDAGDFYRDQAVQGIVGIVSKTIREYADMLKPTLEGIANTSDEEKETDKAVQKLFLQALLSIAKEAFADELNCESNQEDASPIK